MSKVICPEPGSQLTIGSTTIPEAERLTMTRKLASGVATETVVPAHHYDALKRENAELRAAISARNARELALIHEITELRERCDAMSQACDESHEQFLRVETENAELMKARLE